MTTTIAPTIQELPVKNIGDLVKKARTRAGLTQQQLAKRMKVTQGAIFQFEQATDMQLSTVMKIAKCLKITPEELLFGGIGDVVQGEGAVK